jgi:hypothetical protein
VSFSIEAEMLGLNWLVDYVNKLPHRGEFKVEDLI